MDRDLDPSTRGLFHLGLPVIGLADAAEGGDASKDGQCRETGISKDELLTWIDVAVQKMFNIVVAIFSCILTTRADGYSEAQDRLTKCRCTNGTNTKMSVTGSTSKSARYVGSPYQSLFTDDEQSLEEIMQHMRDNFNFTPSKRAFQTQFRRWDFPSKQNPAHRNTDLVSRVKDLWEQNYSQRDMLKTLNEEGYEIKERELMRVRAKNRWLLRIPNGTKPSQAEEILQAQLVDASSDDNLPDDIVRKRKERHEQLQAESDKRWASKKRRRRTREYAGIAADPPGPPRFPSETTLAESMEYLNLDKKQYKDVREQNTRLY
ncbi:hypothetical protein Dsin_033055 [Dipteronia sinensis]|uniref:Clr5 domain-containing protein n=1 Tax=Dipteronia sinensis TaxID=43782 RepID=A0AAD9Z5Z4_9ROSI|nr:hypothetical protein Dsin_033055 [Dipteronia sinensis]